MGGMSWIHWVIVIAIVVILFGGRGKISGLMGDAAKGIRAFKEGLKGDEDPGEARRSDALPRSEREKEEVR
jgi:sec-independent protein translocase protein TatA